LSDHEDHITAELKAIRAKLNEILFGNGRAGMHRMCDDLYGDPRDGSRAGLTARMKGVEDSVEKLARQRAETTWLQRGIAIGMSIVLAEHVFEVPFRTLFGFLGGG
jgi:hypothetical protein